MAPADRRGKTTRTRTRSTRARSRGHKTTHARPKPTAAAVGRARLVLLGAVVISAVVLFAWFPVGSLLNQRSSLSAAQTQLATLHQQDAALSQEKKNLSDSGEIGRIARQQYQLVSPGQQAYEVLPPSGAATPGTPYAGDPGSNGPVAPSATPELPPGGVTTTTVPATHTKSGTSPQTPAQESSGNFVSRVLRSLEFWR